MQTDRADDFLVEKLKSTSWSVNDDLLSLLKSFAGMMTSSVSI